MEIVETKLFTTLITELFADEEYRELQNALLKFPAAGNLMEGGHGLRKLRWREEGSGKRGGLRVIYFWPPNENKIFMVTVYKKNRQETLTSEQLKVLGKLAKECLK